MQSSRDEALANAYKKLLVRQFADKRIKILDKSGDPPDLYRIQLNCKAIESVESLDSGERIYRYSHIIRISSFPDNYPDDVPTVSVESMNDKYIYHPNISQTSGSICLNGGENDSETLESLVIRIIDMIQFRNMNFGIPFDSAIEDWVRNYIKSPLTDDLSSSMTPRTSNIKWGR